MPLFCLNRVNFKKNEKAYNSEGSEVLKALKESENDPVEPGMTWICNFVLEIKTKTVEKCAWILCFKNVIVTCVLPIQSNFTEFLFE